MTLLLVGGVLALAFVPGGLARLTSIHRRQVGDDCVHNCRANFGWPGHPFPNDPWGLVIDPKIIEIIGPAPGPAGVGNVEATPSLDSTLPNIAPTVNTASVYFTPSTPASTPAAIPTNVSVSLPSALNSSTEASSSTSESPVFKVSLPTTSSFAPPKPTSHEEQPSSTSTREKPESPSPNPAPSPSPEPESQAPSSGSNEGSGSTSGPTSESDIQAYLAGHNNIRAQHGAAPLTYSQDLAAKAQQWANGCVFKHSGGSLGPFGENLAAGTGDGYGIPEALKSWSDEASQYNAGNPEPSHFTQMVWKETTQVGCALQNCDGIFASSFGKAHYYVCEYSPQGNIIGDFGTNVQA